MVAVVATLLSGANASLFFGRYFVLWKKIERDFRDSLVQFLHFYIAFTIQAF